MKHQQLKLLGVGHCIVYTPDNPEGAYVPADCSVIRREGDELKLVLLRMFQRPVSHASVVEPIVVGSFSFPARCEVVDAAEVDLRTWVIRDPLEPWRCAIIMPPHNGGIWVDWRQPGDKDEYRDKIYEAKHELWWALVQWRELEQQAPDDETREWRGDVARRFELAFSEASRCALEVEA